MGETGQVCLPAHLLRPRGELGGQEGVQAQEGVWGSSRGPAGPSEAVIKGCGVPAA